MAPILGIIASSKYITSNSYESIGTVTLSSSQSSVTFSSISSGYTHLQLRYIAKSDRATYGSDWISMRLNNDTTANYISHYLYGDGSAAAANVEGTTSMARLSVIGGSGGTSIFGAGVIDILDYKSTNKAKTARALSGVDLNGTIGGYGGLVQLGSGLWFKTPETVDRIDIFPNVGSNFVTYSTFALYGVKA